MDRLARHLEDLRRLVRDLTGRGVTVRYVKEGLTFTGDNSPMATLLLSVMGAFAQFERALIRERQAEGIAARQGPWRLQGPAPVVAAGYRGDPPPTGCRRGTQNADRPGPGDWPVHVVRLSARRGGGWGVTGQRASLCRGASWCASPPP